MELYTFAAAREFIYLVGGGGLCFILYKLLGLILGAIPILVVGGFSIALTFYRPNSKPFIEMVESGFKYFTQSKLYIWKRKMVKTENNQPKIISDNKNVSLGETSAKLNGSRLRDLAWSLDVLDLSKKK
jgi:hypothetical protein